ncbi:hypothetical protein HMPREF9371_2404 [Neisseria shayeganii 871]|uniref:Uncharacterized protein n=1 Tax=Neisseria shayeganii 871 TaxID=1032488 RepID=G4CLB3_9NEIS|nr:hypothetical protein HMPREF9371_2404 [Neisseria shayeganii 871]
MKQAPAGACGQKMWRRFCTCHSCRAEKTAHGLLPANTDVMKDLKQAQGFQVACSFR